MSALDAAAPQDVTMSPAPPEFDAWYTNWGNGTAITGWIVLADTSSIPAFTIAARLNGVAIGQTTVDTTGPARRFNFSLPCDQPFRPVDVVTARLRLYATHPDAPGEVEVRANETLLAWMAKVAFNENIFQHINDIDGAKFILQLLIGRFGGNLAEDRALEAPAGPPKDKASELTPLLHRVGTISRDRSAILGRDGTIFLYEGNNALFSQYQQAELSPAAQTLADEWARIIAERKAYFDARKIPFVQIIIPEKTFALQSRFPIEIKTPTRLLAAVDGWAKDHIPPTQYVSLVDAFRAAPDTELYYQKTDSHFSARGAIATTLIILRALALQNETVAAALPGIEDLLARVQSPDMPTRLLSGDLALRFFGVPLFEEDLDIRYEALFGKQNNVVLDEHYKPPGGNLTNTRMVWHHPDAPLDLRIVAFGNSFFERGGACTVLAWWFKHLCREFHMVWSREISHNYIETVKPDAVICQTIERFLTVVPPV